MQKNIIGNNVLIVLDVNDSEKNGDDRLYLL